MMPHRGGPERTWKRVRTSWSASVCREDSISQMGVVHLWALRIIARKRRGRGNSTLSLLFLHSFAFFSFLKVFSPSLTGTWKWGHSLWDNGGTGIGSWQDQRLWLGWRSLCACSYQMSAYSFPCLPFPVQWWLSKAEGMSCGSCVGNMDRATFPLSGHVQDHQLEEGCFGEQLWWLHQGSQHR